jgi:SAM-dependent methyltransferase
LCQKNKAEPFWAMRGYRLLKCASCTFIWDPTPNENPLLQYDKSYFINQNPKGGYANYFAGMQVNKRTFSQRLKKIKDRMGNKGKLLDVGCALGDCLLEAKKLGWKDILGVDPSTYAITQARKRGIKSIKGTLDNAKLKNNSQDVILYQDVIEHLGQPLIELKNVYRILKPQGLFFLVTPDIGSSLAKLLKSNWYHYKPGEHIAYFSEKTIAKLLKKVGFKAITVQPAKHIMSVEYICKRLVYYSPGLFSVLLGVSQELGLEKKSLQLYTGELEVWAYKD